MVIKLRVIAGYHRSRKLKEVPSTKTRETRDRVKESIFNSLQPYLQGAKVLDLFCGSGSLGIEALSRGAVWCDFNDESPLAIKVASENLANLSLLKQSKTTMSDGFMFLQEVNEVYDIILLDPPYAYNKLAELLCEITGRRLLTENGIIVTLYHSSKPPIWRECGLDEYKNKVMGITGVSYWKWRQYYE